MKTAKLSLLIISLFLFVFTTAELNAQADASEPNLVEVASSNDDFSTLVELVTAAGLGDILQSDEFTILAPPNAAFEEVPQETMEALSNDVELLREVLLTHVISGSVTADIVTQVDEAPTAAGNVLPVNVSGNSVQIGNATVIETDIMASNGVIHVVDSVIMPPEEESSGGY